MPECALGAPVQKIENDNGDWENAAYRILIVRLSPFADISRSTPHLFLHQSARGALGASCYIDFAFLPSRRERTIRGKTGAAWLSGCFSDRAARDFDAIWISCSYALELLNLAPLLEKSQLPLRHSRRGAEYPYILLGGSNALASQSLIFPDGDSFVDGLYFGEGEAHLRELVLALCEHKGMARPALQRKLEETCPSFWAAGLRKPSNRAWFAERGRLKDFRAVPVARATMRDEAASRFRPAGYPLFNTEEAGTARLQISSGCPSFCTFCFEGWERKPYREVPLELLLDRARDLAIETGADTLELYSFNFNTHADIVALARNLNGIFRQVNMMSQRADILEKTPQLLDFELAAQKRSYTIGVEGVSARMRAVYAKGLRDDTLKRLLARLFDAKVREIKLFYILSGHETEDDLSDFSAFAADLGQLKSLRSNATRIIASFAYLVRMPFTPLRRLPLALNKEPFDALMARIRTACESANIECRVAMDWDEYVLDQLLVLGPHELAYALEAYADQSVLFDGVLSGNWKVIMARTLADADALSLASASGPLADGKDADYPWPLPFLEPSVPASHVDRRFEEALAAFERPSCLGGLGDQNDAACQGCGACLNETEKRDLTGHRFNAAKPSDVRAIAELLVRKQQMVPRHLALTLSAALGGATGEFLGAYLQRALLRAEPKLLGRLFQVREALWHSNYWKDRMGPGLAGETVVGLWGMGPAGEAALTDDDLETCRSILQSALASPATILEAFLPDSVESCVAEISLQRDLKAAAELARRWLSDLRLNATERRASEGMRVFELGPKDIKKRILRTLSVEQAPLRNASVLRAEFQSKPDLSFLLRNLDREWREAVTLRRLILRGSTAAKN